MKNQIKTIVLIVILIVFLIIVAFFYFHKTPTPQQISIYKCPEAYTEDEAGTREYRNALLDWTLSFFKANPKATTSDWSMAKLKLWGDNNCAVALERSKLSGKVSDLKKWELVDYEVQNGLDKSIDTLQYSSDLGFSFNYPKDMYVMVDPNGPRLLIIPNSYKTEKNQPMTAIVISAMLNNPPMTPLEWLEGPNSGADLSKGYDKLNIEGQEAISMEGGTWIVVNTPDSKRQLSIATFPSGDGGKLLFAEMGIITSSLIFNK